MRTRAQPTPGPSGPFARVPGDERRTALPPAQPGHGPGDPARGPGGRGLPRPRLGRDARSPRQGAASGALGITPAVGGGEPSFLPVVPADGAARPERLPDVRQAHGAARRDGLSRPAMTRLRLAAIFSAALLCVLAISACGGSSVSDQVPKSTPDIVPPNDTSAEKAASATTSTTATKTTKTSTTGESSESEASEGETPEEESGGTASEETTAGGTGGTEEEKAPEKSSGTEEGASSPTGGASAP